MKDAMLLRNALFPYIYTANHATRTSGVSLVHPTYYEAPDADPAYKFRGQYMFGDVILVAPIVTPTDLATDTVAQTVWLPPGAWVTWDGQQTHHADTPGGQQVIAKYGVGEMPIYVRANAAVPLRNFESLTQTTSFSDPLIWALWPADIPGGGNATVIEDDGMTLRFETDNAVATTHMSWLASDPNMFILRVDPTVGTFDVGCESESGFEYAGAGADLQDIGVVTSPNDCCKRCSEYSNCGFWTFNTITHCCVLKVSRHGRRSNATAVSGIAPRGMPTQRVHGFQIRSSRARPPVNVTANGVVLREVDPDSGVAGWFVQHGDGGLTMTDNTLVVFTDRIPLTQSLQVLIHW